MNDLGDPQASGGADEEARRKRTVQLGAIGVFVLAAVLVGIIALIQSGGDDKDSAPKGALNISNQFEGIPQDGTVLGDPSATVTVLEFGDLQCPICRDFSVKESPTLIDMARDGAIKYEFKIWNIIGPQSKDAGAAAMAASEQNHYWQFVTAFYENQGEENGGYVTPEFLDKIATDAGVPDMDAWHTASDPAKWQELFTANDKEATGLGFGGTPSLSVIGPKGRKDFTGNSVPTLAEIQSAINDLQ